MPIVIQCPSCERSLRVPDNLLGRNVKCPSCSTTFTAEDPAAAPPPPAEEEAPPERPSRRRRAAEEPEESYEEERPSRRGRPRPEPEDEEDDDEERPRRRRRRRGGWREEEAKAAVSGPAIALMIAGILGLVMGGLNIIVAVVNLAGGGGGPGGGNPDPANLVGQVIGAFVSLIWGGIVTAGAVQMKRLHGFGSAMTASIVALLPCNPCCLLGLPFGIWALVVLNRQEVKDAFS
jgi:predicted Zn finger-like uncharacterized protein